MNFFERQDESRRASRRLVLLFVLAVLAVTIAVDAAVCMVAWIGHTRAEGTAGYSFSEWLQRNPGTALGGALIVVAVIALASLYKTITLSGGGGVVARSLGGVRVDPDTRDPLQRRLLNVVEEMAIASGLPVPEVYLLEQESGINAFAAGDNPANAAIGITRGALEHLNRSELQGVIAHEFSHILNGDMRLNVRLIGLLFGLIVIALIARIVLRSAPRARDRKGGAGAIMAAALMVLIIGYVGLFFGRLIQAAVSRRREALADASAVQFTREPSGLRDALVKIAAHGNGSKIANPEVDEVAHMLFAPGMRRLFATHPPLLERLRALDPHFDPALIEATRERMLIAHTQAAFSSEQTKEPIAEVNMAGIAVGAGAIAALVGNPSTHHMQLARDIRKSMPATVVAASRHPHSARALVLALALDTAPASRDAHKANIEQHFGGAAMAAVQELEAATAELEPEQRLPALLAAVPTLRQLPREDRLQLMAGLNRLLGSSTSPLHAYVLRKLAQVHLRDGLDSRGGAGTLTLAEVVGDAQALMSVLAMQGHRDQVSARRAYEAGMHHIYPRERPPMADVENWAARLDIALSRLDRLAPAAKEHLIEALLKTVTHDQQLTIGESELLRTVAATLHCPMPPLLWTPA